MIDFTHKTIDFTRKTFDFTRKTVIYDTDGLPYECGFRATPEECL